MNDLTTILKQLPIIILYAAISLGTYYALKRYVLNKFQLKKKHVFIALIAVIILTFAMPFFISSGKIPAWISIVLMLIFTVIFLLYLDLSKKERIEKNKPVVGKPKAKPSRLKK